VSGQHRQLQRLERAVEDIASSGNISPTSGPLGAIGHALINNQSTHLAVRLGDLSCTCSYSGRFINMPSDKKPVANLNANQ
jgi:hypothetical protein